MTITLTRKSHTSIVVIVKTGFGNMGTSQSNTMLYFLVVLSKFTVKLKKVLSSEILPRTPCTAMLRCFDISDAVNDWFINRCNIFLCESDISVFIL